MYEYLRMYPTARIDVREVTIGKPWSKVCMYVCMYIYIYICVYVCMNIFECIQQHAWT